MSSLTQMQIRYIKEEDRLLLRMNTANQEEFRFWLTRHFTQLFYPLLEKTQHSSPEVKTQTTTSNKKAVLEFQQQKAKSQVQYNTTFAPTPKTYPLGDRPILISKASFKAKGENNYLLQMSATDNKGITFNLDQNLLHVFSALIIDTLPKTNWALDFEHQKHPVSQSSSNILN